MSASASASSLGGQEEEDDNECVICFDAERSTRECLSSSSASALGRARGLKCLGLGVVRFGAVPASA